MKTATSHVRPLTNHCSLLNRALPFCIPVCHLVPMSLNLRFCAAVSMDGSETFIGSEAVEGFRKFGAAADSVSVEYASYMADYGRAVVFTTGAPPMIHHTLRLCHFFRVG